MLQRLGSLGLAAGSLANPAFAIGLVALLLIGGWGCKRNAGSNSSAGDPVAEAAAIYAQRCVACHGTSGKGDGPAAAALQPHPRDFTSPKWQGSITDEGIEKIILLGGAAVGKSATMPGNPDLEGKPAVVTELRKYVRKLGK
jgi:mono/diheme cytochrome c family protein